MSPALANDGVSSIMVLLVVLLAMMLFAVIRAPEWEGSSEEDARPQPATAAPSRPTDLQARAAALLPAMRAPGQPPGDAATMHVPAVATRQPGQAGYAARHVARPVPGEGMIPRPTVSGEPPWGPARKPLGIRWAGALSFVPGRMVFAPALEICSVKHSPACPREAE
jgi:hypothetical protein